MSKISHLSERLQSQIQQEQEALESQTRDALTAHASALKKLSADALTTTKSAIKSESDLLMKSLNSVRTRTEQHIEKLPRLLLLSMLWPVLTTIGLCMLVVILTWIWLPTALFRAQTVSQDMSDNQTYTVIVSPGWTVCEINKKSYPCAPKE